MTNNEKENLANVLQKDFITHITRTYPKEDSTLFLLKCSGDLLKAYQAGFKSGIDYIKDVIIK